MGEDARGTADLDSRYARLRLITLNGCELNEDASILAGQGGDLLEREDCLDDRLNDGLVLF